MRRAILAAALCCGALAVQTRAPAQEPRPVQPGKDVIWLATHDGLIERLLDAARVGAGDYVVDLGSGDGVWVFAAARRGARAHGIEYEPSLVELSRRRAKELGFGEQVSFTRADIFESDFSTATVVTLYLSEAVNLRLMPKLLALRPGTRIVSNSFGIGDWPPDGRFTAYDLPSLFEPLREWLTGKPRANHCFFRCDGFLWVVPARLEGDWRTPDGGLFSVRQTFQSFRGTLSGPGGTVEVAHGRIEGERYLFEVGGARYSGRVAGGVLEGTLERNGAAAPWTAKRR